MEISSLEALKSLAMEGCGVTFLYQAAVRCELADGRLREIELEDTDTLYPSDKKRSVGRRLYDCQQ